MIYWFKKYNHGQAELILLSSLQKNCKMNLIGLISHLIINYFTVVLKENKLSNIHKTELVFHSERHNKNSME